MINFYSKVVKLKKDRALVNLQAPIDIHGSSIEFPGFYDIGLPDLSSDDNVGFQVTHILDTSTSLNILALSFKCNILRETYMLALI